jgi:Xaa-Pro aminopeptidase
MTVPSRLSTISAALAERKIDSLIVTGLPNVRYLSGFTGDNALLLVTPGKSILFTDPRFEIQAAQESSCAVKISKGALALDVIAAVKRMRLKRIGFEPGRMTVQGLRSLDGRLPMGASMVEADGWIEQLRTVKSEDELALIRRAVATNSQAFEQAVKRVKPGMTEAELAAELEHRMRRLGAEKPSFDTIVAGGARSALPHARPTSARLANGQLVVVDMGATQDGYCSDMTRMLFLGEPGAKVKRTYRAVLEAQLAAIDVVRDGARTRDVDAAARRVLKGYGLDRAFVHSTGHGLGLEIHEPPRIGKKDKSRLQAGMAITIEPGVYLERFGGIRIEDTVVVTGSGCEILTPTPKDLRVV